MFDPSEEKFLEDVAGRFSRHGGDLRELLFELYDLYEQRRRQT